MPAIETEDRGAVRHVVLNRPEKRNAFDEAMIVALGEAMRSAADDHDVRVVVLRGAGPMFSSGIDLTELSALSTGTRDLTSFRREWIEVCNLIEQAPKPVVCQIHGTCIGGALETALACDLRVMASDAAVALPETRFGLIPDVGGCSRLAAVVGVGRAKELILTGRQVGGEEAQRIGLANRAARSEELEAVTGELVGELLACAPIAVGLAKRVVDSAAKPALAHTLEQEGVAQRVCAASEDFAEGARALGEQRQPEFANR